MKDYSIIKDITLGEYFEYKGWIINGKLRHGSVTEFAKKCNVSSAYISKLVNNQYISMNSKTKTFCKIKEVVSIDGFNLMKGNPIDLANNCILRENDRLNAENKRLKKENEFMRARLDSLEQIVKLCKKISEKNIF